MVIAAQQVTYRLLNAFVANRSSASQSSSSQFPLEKVCQGEDDSLINYILSVSPLDNKRKCVHSLLLHRAVVSHSLSAGTGAAEKPEQRAEM